MTTSNKWHARTQKKIDVFASMLISLRRLSTCTRTAQAAMVVRPDFQAILSIGYNGPVRFVPNDSCTGKPGACGCAHAEENAIAKLDSLAFQGQNLMMFCTQTPCVRCARVIVNCGAISKLFYLEPYRDLEGLELLETCNIETGRLD